MALKATPPNLVGHPAVDFEKENFDAAIWQKGYSIRIEKALRCPCEGKDGVALSNCENCLGTGYLFINPFETVALITGINRDTQFKTWGEDMIGTISLSIRDDNDDREKVSFYDRISLIKRRADQVPVYGTFSEVLEIRTNSTGGLFVFLTYKIQSVLDILYYSLPNSPLVRIPADKYSINANNPYVLDLAEDIVPTNGVISIRYKHDVQYHVIDLPHEVRYSTDQNSKGRIDTITMPINAVARRSHILQVARANYSGTGIQNNSTQ